MEFALRRQPAFPPRSVRGSRAGLTTGELAVPNPKSSCSILEIAPSQVMDCSQKAGEKSIIESQRIWCFRTAFAQESCERTLEPILSLNLSLLIDVTFSIPQAFTQVTAPPTHPRPPARLEL